MSLKHLVGFIALLVFGLNSQASDTTYTTKKMVLGKREIPMKSTFKVNGDGIVWIAPPLTPEKPEKIVHYTIKSSKREKGANGENVMLYNVSEVGTNEESRIEIRQSEHTLTNVGTINGVEFRVVFEID